MEDQEEKTNVIATLFYLGLVAVGLYYSIKLFFI